MLLLPCIQGLPPLPQELAPSATGHRLLFPSTFCRLRTVSRHLPDYEGEACLADLRILRTLCRLLVSDQLKKLDRGPGGQLTVRLASYFRLFIQHQFYQYHSGQHQLAVSEGKQSAPALSRHLHRGAASGPSSSSAALTAIE